MRIIYFLLENPVYQLASMHSPRKLQPFITKSKAVKRGNASMSDAPFLIFLENATDSVSSEVFDGLDTSRLDKGNL